MRIEEIKVAFNQFLIKNTDFIQRKESMNEDMMKNFVDDALTDFLKQMQVTIILEQRMEIIRSIVSGAESYGPIRPFMEDPAVTEIMINGTGKIYVQKYGKIEKAEATFDSDHQVLHMIQKMLTSTGTNKRVDESSPYVDFSLEDGSRVNVIIPPLSQVGPVVTIRKFKDDITTVDDLLALGELDQSIAELLIAGMQGKLNLVFCGSTGSGKTTALNVFSRYIPEEERIITIEDTPELRLKQEHVVTLCTKDSNIEGKGEITMRQLFVNSLRMRPDRIIVGEVRSEEILDMVESISSGHSGSLSIVHSESSEDCLNRMITMMLMTGIRLSTEEIKRQIARAIDLIIHLELFSDGKRRITSVTEANYDEDKQKVVLRDIFRFVQKEKKESGEIIGEWKKDSTMPSFCYKFEKRNIKLPEGYFE